MTTVNISTKSRALYKISAEIEAIDRSIQKHYADIGHLTQEKFVLEEAQRVLATMVNMEVNGHAA